MTKFSDLQTLRTFVLRARRVQAHSMVQEWDKLQEYAADKFSGSIDISGQATILRPLPSNEEVFESLASRTRPFTLSSESVYYSKVLDAIERLLGEVELSEEFKSQVNSLRRAWTAVELRSSEVQMYSMQQFRRDGSQVSSRVSDIQLAAAWLYSDLVHADVKGEKRKALSFSLEERYAAAVRVFSKIAILTISTLRLIEALRDVNLLVLGEGLWEENVSVKSSELVNQGRAYFGPVGSQMSELNDVLTSGDGWKEFTVTELLRQSSANQVRISIRSEDGGPFGEYDAAVARRSIDSGVAEWDVLVAESLMFKFRFEIAGEELIGGSFNGIEILDPTNELKFKSTKFLCELYRAGTAIFDIAETEFVSVKVSQPSLESQRDLQIMLETFDDIVRIERICQQAFDPCHGVVEDRARIWLRRIRLMLEGQVVRAMSHPLTITSPTGVPPSAVVASPSALNIGDSEIPFPLIRFYHPAMKLVPLSPAPEAGIEAMTYRVEVPSGERFLVWAPEFVWSQEGEELAATATLNLSNIDEDSIRF